LPRKLGGHSPALLRIGLKLCLQGRKFGKRRVRIGRLFAAFEPFGRRPFARRTIGPMMLLMPSMARRSPSIGMRIW
jgi:hypothetical protein